MHLNNFFKAVLKDNTNRILAYGKSETSKTDNTIIFVCDFVPLFRINETVKISRVCGEIEVQEFCGKVFASSKDYLKIIADDGQNLEIEQSLFNINGDIKGSVKYFSLISNDTYTNRPSDIIIYSISVENIKFTSKKLFYENQRLVVNIDLPPLASINATVNVEKVIYLSNNYKSYICKTVNISNDDLQALRNYANNFGRFL